MKRPVVRRTIKTENGYYNNNKKSGKEKEEQKCQTKLTSRKAEFVGSWGNHICATMEDKSRRENGREREWERTESRSTETRRVFLRLCLLPYNFQPHACHAVPPKVCAPCCPSARNVFIAEPLHFGGCFRPFDACRFVLPSSPSVGHRRLERLDVVFFFRPYSVLHLLWGHRAGRVALPRSSALLPTVSALCGLCTMWAFFSCLHILHINFFHPFVLMDSFLKLVPRTILHTHKHTQSHTHTRIL